MSRLTGKDSNKGEERFIPFEKKYQSLFNETNDGVFLMTLQGVHLEVNDRAAVMLGYSVEELLNISFRDIVHEDEISDATSRLVTMQRGGVLPLYERTLRRKDGTPLRVELNVALIKDSDGTPLYIQSVVRDLSERKKLEDSLRESEERYKLLANNAKDVIATLDMNFIVTYVSPSVKSLFGYDVDEVMTKNVVDLLTRKSRSLVLEAMQGALQLEEVVGKDGYEAPPLELQVMHKDGHHMWVEVSRVFLRDQKDKPTGILIIIRDITKRKVMEEALQRSERRYREMIELNPEGITIVDFNEKVLFSNQAFAQMLGYSPQEIQGMNILDFVSPEDKEKVHQQTNERTGGKSSTYDLMMKTKDGNHRIMRISAVPWRNDEGELAGAISVITDITERVRAENDLAASNRDLELYTSLLRHDLRNDLQIILLNAEAIAMELDDDSHAKEICETATYAAERMKQLINAFEIPEDALSNNIVTLLETHARHAEKTHYGLRVIIKTEEEENNLMVRYGRLMPALFDNLLRNSYQHGGPNVEVHMTVSTQGKKVIVDVEDTGQGIEESNRANLFKKGTNSRERGQGLYLCRRIAEAYGGSIEFPKDQPPKGALFRVTLPML